MQEIGKAIKLCIALIMRIRYPNEIPNQSNLWTNLEGYKKDKFTLFIVQFQGKLADMYTSLQSSRLA